MLHRSADIFLAVFYSGVALFYTILIFYKSNKASGAPMVHKGDAYGLHWWNHKVFGVMRVVIWSYCFLRLFIPSLDKYALVYDYDGIISIRFLGIALLLFGFGGVIASHFSLNSAWRSGIDGSSEENLRQSGLYKFSRNPIFIGVTVGQIGFFLALPSGFTLFCLIIGIISINIQIRLEEEHLKKRFNNIYEEYCRLVPRWL